MLAAPSVDPCNNKGKNRYQMFHYSYIPVASTWRGLFQWMMSCCTILLVEWPEKSRQIAINQCQILIVCVSAYLETLLEAAAFVSWR